MFIRSDDTDPISLDGMTINIRRRLNLGQKTRIESAAAMAAGGRDSNLIGALMEAYIHSWSGALFEGVVCNAENIRKLDPDNPLVELVHDEIAERFGRRGEREAPDPN